MNYLAHERRVHAAINGNHATRRFGAAWPRQEADRLSNIFREHRHFEHIAFGIEIFELVSANAIIFRSRFFPFAVPYAAAPDYAVGQHTVNADAEFAAFFRQTARQMDFGSFRGAVRTRAFARRNTVFAAYEDQRPAHA